MIHIETSPINSYGEIVAAHELIDPRKPSRSFYRCQPDKWQHDHQQWCKAYRSGDESAPSPMSEGHSMFVVPSQYSLVAKGETRPNVIRRAIRNSVLSDLNGWDRELRQSADGMRTLAKIVRATVAASMNGQKLGGAHFMACIYAGV